MVQNPKSSNIEKLYRYSINNRTLKRTVINIAKSSEIKRNLTNFKISATLYMLVHVLVISYIVD
jgi:hypothetical protein